MTRSNLKSHLKWLLDQGPSLYPVLTPPAWESHATANPSDSHSAPAPTLNLIESQTEDLSIKDSQPASRLGVNGNADDVIEDDSEEEMARLFLNPPSASKPRMLSRESPGSARKALKNASPPRSFSKSEGTRSPRSKVLKGELDRPCIRMLGLC